MKSDDLPIQKSNGVESINLSNLMSNWKFQIC